MFKHIFPIFTRVSTRNCSFVWNPAPVAVPPCYWTVLANGVRVISEQTCSPLSCVAMYVDSGPRFEVACNNGIAHFIEHMAYKGFSTLRRDEFEHCIHFMGATMSVHTDRETQSFTATLPHDKISTAICYFSRILYDLEPTDQDVESERDVINMEMLDADRNPKQIMYDYLHQSAFQGTPLAQRVIGHSRNIERFDKCFFRNYLCDHYQPYRIVLAASGPFSHQDIVCRVQEYFGSMQATSSDQDLGPCRFTGSSIVFRDDSLPFAHIALAVEVPGLCSKEYWALRTLKCLMGRWNKSIGGGMKAWPRVARASAVDDICDSYEGFYLAYRDVGLWGVYTICKQREVENMTSAIQDEWMHMCTTIVKADVDRARSALELEVAKSIQGAINSVHDMGLQMLYTCARMSFPDVQEALANVTLNEVSHVANRYLYDKCPVVVGVGPTEALPDYTRIRAQMYWLRV